MQHTTVATYLQHRTPSGGLTAPEGHETLPLSRPSRFTPWALHGAEFTLFPIRPGQTYTTGTSTVRTITCSPIQ